jgi:hypothetical protein
VTAITPARSHGELLYRPTGTGETFLGPGDLYQFLVTGAESGGAYFAMEAYVPPGGGPPPHIHRRAPLRARVRRLIAWSRTWSPAGPHGRCKAGLTHK